MAAISANGSSELLCFVLPVNTGRDSNMQWVSKTCLQLWHNTATVEEDIRNKK